MSQHSLFRQLHSLIDDNISRQGLFSPHWGTRVVPLSQVSFARNDIVVVFAWRFIEPIRLNIKAHCQKYQLPLPKIINGINALVLDSI